jgi:hypothetical protein
MSVVDVEAGLTIPAGTKNERIVVGPQRQVSTPIVQPVRDYDRWSLKQRMEWIGDCYLLPQTPGIMRLLRMAVASIGRSLLHSSRPASSVTSNLTPT